MAIPFRGYVNSIVKVAGSDSERISKKSGCQEMCTFLLLPLASGESVLNITTDSSGTSGTASEKSVLL